MSNKKSDDASSSVEMTAAGNTAASAANPEAQPLNAATPVVSPTTATSASAWPTFTLPMSALNFAACCVSALFATLTLIGHVKSNPSFYTQSTPLSSGQIMAFLVAFFVSSAWVGVHLRIAKEYLTKNNINSNTGAADAAVSSNSEFTNIRRRVVSDEDYDGVSAAFQFTLCLLLFFVCDRTKMLQRGGKKYNRDTFWFLCLLLLLVGLSTLQRALKPKSRRSAAAAAAVAENNKEVAPTPSEGGVAKSEGGASAAAAVAIPAQQQTSAADTDADMDDGAYHIAHLQREQTEEWKGWMQVMFLWYHYFNAKEIYNLIRLFIAAYVWMTGFGNFSYYYIKKDFTIFRFFSMQWRLNFLVMWACLLLQNEYMLYYICMLHTTFTVFIYAGLGIASEKNYTFSGCVGKFALLTVVSLIIWDIDGVFEWVWAPLGPLVNFHNPYKKAGEQDPMYEWKFRSKLDHLIWVFGMICAFNHPTWEGLLKQLDALPKLQGGAIKAAVVGVCAFLLKLYYERVFSLQKGDYNGLHPYTSFIPIFLYIVLRNIFQFARQFHIHLFEWLGKITLETYISQYHIWMATTGINGSPKKLLQFLPGDLTVEDYPLLNFAAASALCLFVSHRLFNNTLQLKGYLLPSALAPHSEQVRARIVVLGAWTGALYVAGYVICFLTTSASAQTASGAPVA